MEEEYKLTLKYLDVLKKEYDSLGFEIPGKEKDVPVITVWIDLIEQAATLMGKEETYTVVSKDFQRFFTSFFQYSNILDTMWKSTGNSGEDKKKYEVLIRKIVGQGFNFFENTFHDDSNNFFKLRKWTQTFSDKILARKINSHLDCIVTGLFRQLKRKYGNSIRKNS